MELVPQCSSDIERHEGFRQFAYPDPLSYLGKKYKSQPWGRRPAREIMTLIGESDFSKGVPWTVGIGDTIGVGPDTQVSLAQARSKLSTHIAKNLRELDQSFPAWKTMPFVIQTVLVNLTYNMGIKGLLKFKNTLKYLEQKNWAAAAANLERSLWYKQVGRRAVELVKRVRTQEIEPNHLVP